MSHRSGDNVFYKRKMITFRSKHKEPHPMTIWQRDRRRPWAPRQPTSSTSAWRTTVETLPGVTKQGRPGSVASQPCCTEQPSTDGGPELGMSGHSPCRSRRTPVKEGRELGSRCIEARRGNVVTAAKCARSMGLEGAGSEGARGSGVCNRLEAGRRRRGQDRSRAWVGAAVPHGRGRMAKLAGQGCLAAGLALAGSVAGQKRWHLDL